MYGSSFQFTGTQRYLETYVGELNLVHWNTKVPEAYIWELYLVHQNPKVPRDICRGAQLSSLEHKDTKRHMSELHLVHQNTKVFRLRHMQGSSTQFTGTQRYLEAYVCQLYLVHWNPKVPRGICMRALLSSLEPKGTQRHMYASSTQFTGTQRYLEAYVCELYLVHWNTKVFHLRHMYGSSTQFTGSLKGTQRHMYASSTQFTGSLKGNFVGWSLK